MKKKILLLISLLLLLTNIGLVTASEQISQAKTDASKETLQSKYELAVKTSRFELFVNEKEGEVKLIDANKKEWLTTPAGVKDDKLAQGAAKIFMQSLLQVQYIDKQGNMNFVNSKASSVNKGGVSYDKTPDSIIITHEFPKEGFTIPIEIKCNQDHISVVILSNDIVEKNANYKISTISLLPYFGAADNKTNGYIFVPDGSGAIIELNKQNGFTDDYSQYIYGREPATIRKTVDSIEKEIKLPVFGMKDNDDAFVGIVTTGASRGKINAAVNGKRCSYNNVYAEFIYRDTDLVLIEKKGQTVTVAENLPVKTNFQVDYYFLNGEKANYVGMANTYREHLIKNKGLKDKEIKTTPLFLGITGGVTAQRNVLGFPVKQVVPLTSYDDVTHIVDKLKKDEIEDIVINYSYWNKNGTDAPIQTNIKAEGKLGGKKKFESMLKSLNENGVKSYLDFNFTDIVKSKFGFTIKGSSVLSIQKNPAMQYIYTLNDLKAVQSQPTFLLNINKINKAVNGVLKDANKFDFTGLSANSMASTLYSDFSDKTIKRDEAVTEWSKVLQKLYNSKNTMLLSNANEYALMFADYLIDTPINSSGFLIESYSIPFYQIALHGLVNMSTPSVNYTSDKNETILKALESGIGIKYDFVNGNSDKIMETKYNNLTRSAFSDWKESATQQYKEIAPIINKICDKAIVGHDVFENGLRKTTFENGVQIIVNFSKSDLELDGHLIKSKDYKVIGG